MPSQEKSRCCPYPLRCGGQWCRRVSARGWMRRPPAAAAPPPAHRHRAPLRRSAAPSGPTVFDVKATQDNLKMPSKRLEMTQHGSSKCPQKCSQISKYDPQGRCSYLPLIVHRRQQGAQLLRRCGVDEPLRQPRVAVPNRLPDNQREEFLTSNHSK